MKKIKTVLWLLNLIILVSCTPDSQKEISIIPEPKSLVQENGEFIITTETKIYYDNKFEKIDNAINYFNSYLLKSNGFELESVSSETSKKNFIYLKQEDSISNKEGYELASTIDGVTISAFNSQGIFNGIQSLLQLLPSEVYSQTKLNFALTVPVVLIKDEPRFNYRGVHLDVGRHFYPKEDIKKYIDYLAMHKINKFHWHLTEDQGWRIEIKEYPKLTEIGAWRNEADSDGKPYGGFYTQEDVKEIVKYASDRFITIIPEIEMPGHSMAALAAYPDLSCTGGPFEVATEWGVHKEVYCAGNEKTFKFLEDVLTEVVELFPSEYVHIGGDECPKDRWEKCSKCQARIKKEKLKNEHELQSYFIQRIEKFLLTKNRKIIGWDEILEGGLAPQATVMSWRGIEGGIEAAKQNHDVIMTPGSHCYFDHYQGDAAFEPGAFGNKLTLTKVYSYEPIPEELNSDESQYILGAQANVWTERLPKFTDVEYMLMPRLSALSEVVWTQKENKDINRFISRMDKQFERYEYLNVNYAKSAYNVAINTEFNDTTETLDISMHTEIASTEIYYTLDGSEPNNHSTKYSLPLRLNESTTIKAVAYKNNRLMSKVTQKSINVHKGFGKNITLKFPYSEKYSAGGNHGLVNGLFGSSSLGDGYWQGFEGDDFEAIIDLGNLESITTVESDFLQNNSSWVFLPRYVEYSFSEDGINFSQPVVVKNDIDEKVGTEIVKNFSYDLKDLKTRYIKIFAKNIGVCPEWHLGAGGKAWLFVDEIVIK